MRIRELIGAVFVVANILCPHTHAFAAGWKYTTIASRGLGVTPEGGGFGDPAINDKGVVSFTGSALVGGGSVTGVWTWSVDKGLEAVTTTPATENTTYMNAQVNNSGSVSYMRLGYKPDWTPWQDIVIKKGKNTISVAPYHEVTSAYFEPNIFSDNSVLFWQNGVGELLFHNGITSPVAPGHSTELTLAGSPNGYIAFIDGPAGQGGLYQTGRGLPITLRGTSPEFGQITSAAISNKGTIAFSATGVPGNVDGVVTGLFVQSATGAVRRLAEVNNGSCTQYGPFPGTPLPCTTYTDFGYFPDLMSINADDNVVATVLITNWVDMTFAKGVVLNGDRSKRPDSLARHDDQRLCRVGRRGQGACDQSVWPDRHVPQLRRHLR